MLLGGSVAAREAMQLGGGALLLVLGLALALLSVRFAVRGPDRTGPDRTGPLIGLFVSTFFSVFVQALRFGIKLVHHCLFTSCRGYLPFKVQQIVLNLLTYLFTYLFTNLFIYFITYLLTCLFTYLFTYLIIYLLNYLLLIYLLTYLLIY